MSSARLEAILDAGYVFCAACDDFREVSETVQVAPDGERMCRAHANAMLQEEERQVAP